MLLKLNEKASIAAIQFKVRDLLISVMPAGHNDPKCPGVSTECPHDHSLQDSCHGQDSIAPPGCPDDSKEFLEDPTYDRRAIQEMRTKVHFELQHINAKVRDEILLPEDPKMLEQLVGHLEYALKVVKKHAG